MESSFLETTAGVPVEVLDATETGRDYWFLLRYLHQTRDGVSAAVEGLSAAQWAFSAGSERWSIAHVVEHLAAAEEFILQRIVPQLKRSLDAATTIAPLHEDARVLEWERDPGMAAVVAGRVPLNKAPGPIQPTGRWTPAESLRRFLAARVRTIEHLQSATELRRQVVEHLALGTLDGYQWVLFIAAHTERHARQIAGIKADPGFPSD